MLSAGQRDRRIQVLKRQETRGASGGVTVTWVPAFRLWAAAHDRTGRERLMGGQEEVAAWDIRFTVLYRADVARTDRIQYGADTFSVRHIDELGRRDGLVLLCSLELSND